MSNYCKSEDLIKDGYKFCEKLTNISFGVLNKYEHDPARAYDEIIKFIKESELFRATDDIKIGYEELLDSDDKVIAHAFGVFVKGNDSPRKVIFTDRQNIINNEYPPHIKRLLEEREELLDRLEKLTIFINTSKFFKELPDDKGVLLRLQFEPMLSYLNILDKRLELENIKVRNPKVELSLN